MNEIIWKQAVDTLASMCLDDKMGRGPTKEAFVSNLRMYAGKMGVLLQGPEQAKTPAVGSATGLYTPEQVAYVAGLPDDLASLKEELLHQIRLRDNLRSDRDSFERKLNHAVDVVTDARNEATRVATSLYRKWYAKPGSQWKPLPSLLGLLTQIDNMTAFCPGSPGKEKGGVTMDRYKRVNVFFERHIGLGIRWQWGFIYPLEVSLSFPFATVTVGFGKSRY